MASMAPVATAGAMPNGCFNVAERTMLKQHADAAAKVLDEAAALQTAVQSGTECTAQGTLALQAAHCLTMEMRARANQQLHTQNVSAKLSTCLHWALKQLMKADDKVAAARAALEVSTHSAASSRSNSLRLPRSPPGVYEYKEGESIHFWTACIKTGGYWYRQEKSKFLAALQRELQGLKRGLNPVQHPEFGWTFGGAGWMWAELDDEGSPNGCFLWSGPDPDRLPDDTTEKNFEEFWSPGGTVIRFFPVWQMRPPTTVDIGTLSHRKMVPADDSATSAQAAIVSATAVVYVGEDGEACADETKLGDMPGDLDVMADMSSGAATLLAAARAASPHSDGGSTLVYEEEEGQ